MNVYSIFTGYILVPINIVECIRESPNYIQDVKISVRPINIPNCKTKAPIDILAGVKRYPNGRTRWYLPQQCENPAPPPPRDIQYQSNQLKPHMCRK